MSLTDQEVKEKLFIGAPIYFEDICLIRNLTIGDKIRLGPLYDVYLNDLVLSEEDIEEFLVGRVGAAEAAHMARVTPFQYLMLSAQANVPFLVELKNAFSTFIGEEITIIPRAQEVLIGKIDSERKITEENFEAFQRILRIENHLDVPEEIPEDEDEMHKKFRLRRRQVKKAKAKQSQKDGGVSFLDLMSSVCTMGVGITWNNIKDVPIFTFNELLSRCQLKEKFDIDTRSLLAGADSKKVKLKYWISSTDE